jgi:putative membrane protein
VGAALDDRDTPQGVVEMMFGYGSGVGFGLGGWLGILGMVAIIVGVILLIVWLVGRVATATQPQTPSALATGNDAVELLRMRFARGEITEDEYRSARRILEEGR